MTDADLAFTPAVELARLVTTKQVKPTELCDLYLRRIDALNPELCAYITVAADMARAAALQAEERLTSADSDELPPFHGVPISVKDNTAVAGLPTTQGLEVLRDVISNADAPVVTKIKDAGFVILGKTNLPELASTGMTKNRSYGICRNPWDPTRTPGGSSGGAASALAAGLCPVSHGSDSGGSIRLPAAWSGVYGIKPARGRISRSPMHLLSVYGPLARTVADAAAMLDVMSGYIVGDLWWAPPPQRPFIEEARTDPGRLRIAFTTAEDLPNVVLQDEIRDAILEAAKTLESLGHDVVADAPQFFDPDRNRAEHPVTRGFLAAFGGAAEDLPPIETLDPLNQMMITMGKQLTIRDMVLAERLAEVETRRLVSWWFDNSYDLLVMPATAATAPRVDEFDDAESAWAGVMKLATKAPFTGAWNMTGQPAVSIPFGFDRDGLPIALQLVGRPGDEATLIRVSAQLEQAKPWIGHRPAVS